MLNSLVRVSRRDELAYHWSQHFFSFFFIQIAPKRFWYNPLHPKNPDYNWSESNYNVIPMNRKRTKATSFFGTLQWRKRILWLFPQASRLIQNWPNRKKSLSFEKEKPSICSLMRGKKNYQLGVGAGARRRKYAHSLLFVLSFFFHQSDRIQKRRKQKGDSRMLNPFQPFG